MAVKCPMKEAGNGHGASIPDWTFVLQRYTIHFENKGCYSLFLIANNSLGFPFVF